MGSIDKLDYISQWIVPFSTVLSIAFFNLGEPIAKWGSVVGFVSQPFWIITSYKHRQVGVQATNALCCAWYAYGIYKYFLAG